LHEIGLARVRAALADPASGRYCHRPAQHPLHDLTVIGGGGRDKLTRYSLLTGNGDPYILGFRSAANTIDCTRHGCTNDHCRAGLLGLRGAVGRRHHAVRDAAKEIKGLLARGCRRHALGLDVVEPPMLF